MTPEHKFATAARLCQEVLGGVADGALPLEEAGEVLGDALRVLSSKHIKVSAGRGGAAAAADDDDPSAAVGAAKGKLVSQVRGGGRGSRGVGASSPEEGVAGVQNCGPG